MAAAADAVLVLCCCCAAVACMTLTALFCAALLCPCRYAIMRDYMPTRGDLGRDMMFRSCTIQVNLDFESEADMVEKMRIGMALQVRTNGAALGDMRQWPVIWVGLRARLALGLGLGMVFVAWSGRAKAL